MIAFTFRLIGETDMPRDFSPFMWMISMRLPLSVICRLRGIFNRTQEIGCKKLSQANREGPGFGVNVAHENSPEFMESSRTFGARQADAKNGLK